MKKIFEWLQVKQSSVFDIQTILDGRIPVQLPHNLSDKNEKPSITIKNNLKKDKLNILSNFEKDYIAFFTGDMVNKFGYKSHDVLPMRLLGAMIFPSKDEFICFWRGTPYIWYNFFKTVSTIVSRRILYIGYFFKVIIKENKLTR